MAASPNASSRADRTPAGTSSSPWTMPTRSIRSAEAGGAVAANRTGRVCGAGAGKAPRPTTIRTRHERANPTTASVKARHWKSGSGPTRYNTSAPAPSGARRTPGGGRRPLEVRLGADQVQHVGPGAVVAAAHHGAGPGQLGGHAVDDAGHRTAGPLVQEVLAVEGDQRLGRSLGQQGGDGRCGTQSGVHPSLEGNDEHRAVQLGFAVHLEDLGQSVGAHGVASRMLAAAWSRLVTCTGKASTLPWSPAPAPAT